MRPSQTAIDMARDVLGFDCPEGEEIYLENPEPTDEGVKVKVPSAWMIRPDNSGKVN